MKIRFIRFDDEAEIPIRKHHNDTGADIIMNNSGIVKAGETVVIPLGFGIDIPDGYNAYIQCRTSVAMKGLFVQQCAIDAGYKGEIHLILHNLSKEDYSWCAGERLAYIEVFPCTYPEFVEDLGEEREDGWAGSTRR